MVARSDKGAPERVVVIGLGRFGTSAARTLSELGYEVTAIDIDEARVNDIASVVTLAAQGDGTDEELLRSLTVDRSNFGVVAQGESLEANVLTTLVLKRIGVPWVVAKATSELHGELLRRIGADGVVFPERDAGVRLSHSLAVRHITDYIPLGLDSGIAKLTAPNHFIGMTIADLGAPYRDRLQILVLKRGATLITQPAPDERVKPSDELLIVGTDRDIDALADPEPSA